MFLAAYSVFREEIEFCISGVSREVKLGLSAKNA
jgi:hypothetical protein